jgi:hypothetical protein
MKDRKRLIKRKRKTREKKIRLGKNFLPSLILTILLWLGLFYVFFFVDPNEHGAIQIFFAVLTFTLTFTLSIAFANTRRGLIATGAIILFLVLRYLGVGNIVNLILIAGLAVTAELYLNSRF